MVSISLIMFVVSLIAVPLIAIYIRPDYFLHASVRPVADNPIQLAARILKNLVGAIFFVMGIAMLVLPGQGILTILIGMSLVDFPGKRRLQLRILRMRRVRRSIDWMRKKAGRAPLQLPSPPRRAPRRRKRRP